MDDNEYLEAWGEDGGKPVETPTPERVKHQKKLQDEEQEYLDAFRDDKAATNE